MTRIADRGWGPPVDLSQDGIEPPKTTEAGPHGDLCHRQNGLVEHAFSSLHAGSLGNLGGAGTKVVLKKSAQMPCTDTQPTSQDFDTVVI
jgi:hypothetical protein